MRTHEDELNAQPLESVAEAPDVGSQLYSVEELTVGTLFERSSEIAMELSPRRLHRRGADRAAFAIRDAAKGLERDEVELALSNPHEMS